MSRLPPAVIALAAVALVVATGGARFELALEDSADPAPRQIAMGVQIADACLGLAISWTARRGR